MEQSSAVPPEQGRLSSLANQLKSLRTRAVTAFNGPAVIEPRPAGATPRIGLQFLPHNHESNGGSSPGMPHTRRDHSSNDHQTEAQASPALTTWPLPAAYTTPSSRSSSEGRSRANRSTHRNGRNAGRRRRRRRREGQYAVAWVRPVHDPGPSKVSGVYRSCLGPGLKTKAAKRKIMECAVAAALLSIVLALYLTLAFSEVVKAREFHILMILMLMMLTVYLCHSLIRLVMVSSRRYNDHHHAHRRARTRAGPSGCAHPERPIPVTLARDEEITVGERERTDTNERSIPPPPPAYGLWRGSVRINPNLIHWERANRNQNRELGTNENNAQNQNEEQALEAEAANRPPSYISDDGVQYVVDIQPQRTVGSTRTRDPGEELIHPAERNQTKS